MKKQSKKNHLLKLLSFFGIIIAVCLTTIGYSAFNSNLNISGEAIVKVFNNLSIVDVAVLSVENGAYEQYNNSYYIETINYHLNLPNPNSTITYKINTKNKTNRDYGIALISGLPDNLTYEFINYNLGDKLCTNNTCNNNSIDEVQLKIKYKEDGYDSSSTIYSGRMKISFEHFYNVVYVNVADSNSLKQTILSTTNYIETIPIPENMILKIRMNGAILLQDTNYTYDDTTNLLTIPNVNSNIVITIEERGIEFELINTGNGSSFEYTNTGYDISSQTFFLEADLSDVDLTHILENIISIGNDVGNWAVSNNIINGVNMHIYFPATANVTTIQADLTYRTNSNYVSTKVKKTLDLENTKLLRIALNSNGLYINGAKIFDSVGIGANVTPNPNNVATFLPTFFNYWETNNLEVSIGSLEGSNRSNANYSEIKIYNQLMTEEELIEKTKIRVEEKPNQEELTYNQASSVIINNVEQPMTYPFRPNDQKFLFTSPAFIDLNSNSLYFEMDVSNLKENAELENLIGIGNNFDNWTGTNVFDIYLFYPSVANSNSLIVSVLNSTDKTGQFKGNISLVDNKYIKMVLSKNGLYINGEVWLDSSGNVKSGLELFGNQTNASIIASSFFQKFTFPNDNNLIFKYGSEQGSARSTAVYTDVRVYNGNISHDDAIELTS